ncbi:DUF349 domain-containing protein [uncultured Marinobacter sp.]|uniref:DUF349 domain-containing protein n=1 Tax=uncultured Marinobacter sp. TaxID=187379 RepID=UPI000C0A9A1D|nr:hypothetical protein [Marinobacter sp.]MBI42345.1 hypothetical protein [Oceanospirillales bacterium]|tara:strand:+ start:4477 stop:6942 length:2466 start_codon:yes stop_codon:yes gene_type:complete
MAAFIQKLFKSRKSSPTQDLPRHQPPAHVGEESGEDPRAEQRERQRRVLAGEAPEQTLAQLAIEGITAEIRLEAARRLTSQGVLTDVMKHSKGRDKGVYQIVKHALQTLKEEAQRQEAIANTIRTLIASAEDQARSEDTTLYQARLDALLNQWHAVEAQASAEQSQRFLEAVHRCRQRLQDIEAEQQEALRHDEQRRQRQETLALLAETLDGLTAPGDTPQPSVSALDALLRTQENRWLEATRDTDVTRQEQKSYEARMLALRNYLAALRRLAQARESIEQLLAAEAAASDTVDRHEQARTLLQELAWPAPFPLPPQLTQLRKLTGKRPEPQPRDRADQAEQAQSAAALKTTLDQLQSALDAKQFRESKQLLKTAQHLFKALDESHGKRFQARLQLLTGQFRELSDWQGFVTEPKQIALCEQMEYLAEQPMEPEAKAERIKELQNEWRALGGSSDRTLWTRFKTASDRAFEPCKAYFEAKTDLKQANLDKRQAICQQLQTFLDNADWNSIDWKGVERIHQTARQEWKEAWPVDFRENRPLQKRFDALLRALEKPLDEERARNEAQKRAIVERARALIDHEPLQEAMNEAKSLQAEWKSIGITRHREDRKLWQAFRQACDQIFARRDARNQARQQATEAADRAAGERLRESAGITETAAAPTLAEALARLDSLDLSQLSAPVRERVVAEKQRLAKAQRQRQLADTVDHWRTLIAASANGGIAPEQIPDHWRERIDGQPAFSGRELVIRAEILAGVDSPESDQQQRMEIQVKRLAEGLGQGEKRDDPLAELELLVAQWCLNAHTTAEPGLADRLASALGKARG